MKFDGKCPFCGSANCDVGNSTQPEWGNNDEGVIDEDWTCNDCRKAFSTHARIQVVYRELQMFNLFCPYCDEDNVIFTGSTDFGMDCYRCAECNRFFWIKPDDYYKRAIE